MNSVVAGEANIPIADGVDSHRYCEYLEQVSRETDLLLSCRLEFEGTTVRIAVRWSPMFGVAYVENDAALRYDQTSKTWRLWGPSASGSLEVDEQVKATRNPAHLLELINHETRAAARILLNLRAA